MNNYVGQTKKASIIETVVNVAVGFWLAFFLTYIIFGISFVDNLWISSIFTLASIIRGYVLRRIFNLFMVRSDG